MCLNSLSVLILVLIFETHSASRFFDRYVTIGCYYTTFPRYGRYPGLRRSLSKAQILFLFYFFYFLIS